MCVNCSAAHSMEPRYGQWLTVLYMKVDISQKQNHTLVKVAHDFSEYLWKAFFTNFDPQIKDDEEMKTTQYEG